MRPEYMIWRVGERLGVMRHEQIENHGSFDIVELAQVWPNGSPSPVAPLSEIAGSMRRSTAAAPDVPVAAGVMMVAAYGALFAGFPLLIAHDGSSAFAIAMGAFYLFMFFGIPFLFFKVEGDTTRRPELSTFLERGMHTATGHISGKAALAQMLAVPVLLAFGVLAIGLLFVLL